MENKSPVQTSPILIILLVIVAFLAGTLFMKIRDSKNQVAKQAVEQASSQPGSVAGAFTASKTTKPKIQFFVMSFCPYGNQAENGLAPVAKLLGDKVEWVPSYIVSDAKAACETKCQYQVYDEATCQKYISGGQIPDQATCKKYMPYSSKEECLSQNCSQIQAGQFSSLHGDQELNQGAREICAWNPADSQKWWDFVLKVNQNCTAQNADTCWEAQAKAVGLDAQKISQCVSGQASTLFKEQLAVTDKLRVQGSPTVYINDILYNGGRQPEDYKKAICQSFTTEPAECNQVLSTTTAAPAPGSCN